jgi:hypothetical protein
MECPGSGEKIVIVRGIPMAAIAQVVHMKAVGNSQYVAPACYWLAMARHSTENS